MITPSGHYLGRKPDGPDPRDHRYSAVHQPAAKVQLPARVDLRAKLPPAFSQGELGSCGLNSASAMLCMLYPKVAVGAFSRLQMYYDVRVIEKTVDEDAGVETRDVFKAMQLTGAAPEDLWPYKIAKFKKKPSPEVYAAAERYTISTYSRLVAESSFLSCLASGFPFILGFQCFASIDSDQLAKTGVMIQPGKGERVVGGHAVLVVGYDTAFKKSADFKASGADPALVSDRALLIRNSWGSGWGIKGHFWMPIEYASNPSTGGDAWTGRL